jgi:REP element-mobilizing transposase RayT
MRDFSGESAMTIARRQLIDVSVTRWYRCISRCVRGASLLGDGSFDRNEWLETRIEELAQVFAMGVGRFSVMDNHLHLLLRSARIATSLGHLLRTIATAPARD